MSDVLQGGSTVFVTAGKGAILKPKKACLALFAPTNYSHQICTQKPITDCNSISFPENLQYSIGAGDRNECSFFYKKNSASFIKYTLRNQQKLLHPLLVSCLRGIDLTYYNSDFSMVNQEL